MSERLSQRIPVSGPWITEREVEYVTDAARNAWYANHNTYHNRFEQAFCQYLGVAHAMALPSCTAALHLALLALGVGPGDEVIVPDITWIASAAPVSYVGATPVFADIDPVTWCISTDGFRECITPKTRAVIPVDLYGSLPDYGAIARIAAEHGIAVIEDAAEAIGSRRGNAPAGSFGDVSVFSFHGSKTLTTGEGGLLATNNAALFARAQTLRDHGRPPGDRFFRNTEVAYKYKMSSMQAALGLAQLERVDELVARKRQIFSWYREELGALEEITLNAEPAGTLNSYWMNTVIADRRLGVDKQTLMQRLDSAQVDSRPFFFPLSDLPAYAALPESARARVRNRVSYDISPRGVNLPSGLNLSREDVAYVCKALREALAS